MSELKCPACTTVLSEPLPERCPTCQLEGLNKMFLTLEDNKNWKKTVLNEHIKKLRNHKIFIGAAHVLILLNDGKLFQIEGNYEPTKIAENVVSATAGYNYSLYLDAEGKVHFLGNSGIPFKERFNQGNLVFKEVYAHRKIDIFGVRDVDNNFYAWGDNHSEKIRKKSTKILKTFKTRETICISAEVEKWYNHNEHRTGERKFSYSEAYPSDILFSIWDTDDYKIFCKCYGADNLNVYAHRLKSELMKICEVPEDIRIAFNDKFFKVMKERDPATFHCSGGSFSPPWKIYKYYLEPRICFTDNYIFSPFQVDKVSFGKIFNEQAYPKEAVYLEYFRFEGVSLNVPIDKTPNEPDGGILRIFRGIKEFVSFSNVAFFYRDGGYLYFMDYFRKFWRISAEKLFKFNHETAPEELLEFICKL